MAALLPFTEAIKMLAQKDLLPTSMSSAELRQLRVDVRERSLFSARTMMEDYLKDIGDKVEKIVNPQTVIRDGKEVTEGLDLATARLELKKKLEELGYSPEPGKAGSIEDLSSDARLNLVLQTNTQMAQGYGAWRRGQDPVLLDSWPAQRLYRLEDRKEPRDWHERAKAAAAETGSKIVLDGEGFVALKNDPVWEAISEFGTPYPPFDFNSGMWVEDVSREEAIDLGLIDEDQQIQPQIRPFELEAA